MDPDCLKHALTPDEKRRFDAEGYLILEDVLPPDRVARLTGLCDRIHAHRVAAGFDPAKPLFHPNFLPEDPAFAALVDDPRVLPKVWGLLGWNIYVYYAHLIVTPPSGEAVHGRTLGWHQDSDRVNVEIESHPRPRLSLKVAYFLSDASRPGRANFWVIPGSHLADTLDLPDDRVGQPEGAMPVCVEPGTAVLFDRRLWHSGSPNWSDVTRKVLFYGYAYRWLRTKDDMTVRALRAGSDPIRRQLLGDGVNADGYYSPTDADVPLRVWLRAHRPQDAV
jgi:ectoine hydroxylase-related dioxygenase (phytanoyl-CoA dioxygenase family)